MEFLSVNTTASNNDGSWLITNYLIDSQRLNEFHHAEDQETFIQMGLVQGWLKVDQ